MNSNKFIFSPLIFLSSLGAGGIAVAPFAFLQYTFHRGKGLVQYSHINWSNLSGFQYALFNVLLSVMVIFALIHLILVIFHTVKFVKWLGSDSHREMLNNPLANAALMTPIISYTMTMNVFIGPIRFFVKPLAENLQTFMLPAFGVWSLIWVAALYMGIKLIRISFIKSFDVSKINFGWLLHPFALGMVTVTGMGIAAMSHNSSIANSAAFMSLVTGTMGFFLLTVKLNAIFKSHFDSQGLPERQFLPSYLIVVPNITLYAISLFRFGHYINHQHGMDMGAFIFVIMGLCFAFETWYMLFGVALLSDYLKNHFFTGEFYVTQWGFVCPVVAYAVLASFMYRVFTPSIFFYGIALFFTALAVILFFLLLNRQRNCSGIFLTKERNECI